MFHPAAVPSGLLQTSFRLEPLTADHVELDYEAVMASRVMLRRWGGTAWPADDFTLAGNLEDLEMHDGEHRRGEAFTFTVLTPDRDRCLGCVYITPLARLVDANPDLPAGSHDAGVGWWVRSDHGDVGLPAELLESLRLWFSTSWRFDRVVFSVRSELPEQVTELRRAGMAEVVRVSVPGRTGVFVLYE